jgi:hypothetical protein
MDHSLIEERATELLNSYTKYMQDERFSVISYRYACIASGIFMGSLGFYLLLSKKF